MKSIIYILLVVLISGILISALPKSIYQKQVITIQCLDESPNTISLDKSYSIIKNRLNDYGLKGFEVLENSTQKTIYITFKDKVDVNEILPLILSKGKLEIFETQDRRDVLKPVKKADKLYSLLNISSDNSVADKTPAVLGYCNMQNKPLVDSIIATQNIPDQGTRYLWGERSKKDGNYLLYLLKPQPVMDNSQVLETVLVNRPDGKDNSDLMINFNNNGALVWQHLSKNNIGKQIAVVIDDVVYCAPKLMGEINNGKCIISGNFSLKEVIRLKTLIGNGELPLDFKLKE